MVALTPTLMRVAKRLILSSPVSILGLDPGEAAASPGLVALARGSCRLDLLQTFGERYRQRVLLDKGIHVLLLRSKKSALSDAYSLPSNPYKFLL